MWALDNCRMWISRASHQPPSVRVLAACAGVLAVAVALTTPAEADPVDDAFLSTLDGAGINYGDAGSAVALAQSICPMLAQDGGTFAAAADSVTGNGIPAPMANMFVTIAMQQYCPSAMASIEKGQLPSLPQIPGVPAL